MLIRHSQKILNINDVERDGDHDAISMVIFQKEPPGEEVSIFHPLKRIPKGVQIYYKNAPCDWWWAEDSDRQPKRDEDKINLKFTAQNVILGLRIW